MLGPLNLVDTTRAPLVMAFLLLALLPVALISIPIQTHGVSLDMSFPEAWEARGVRGAVHHVQPVRRARGPWRHARPRSDRETPFPFPATPPHRLEMRADREMRLDGRRVDRTGLRMELDRLRAIGGRWVDVRPEAYVRYEDFAEVMAVFARADFDLMILDNRDYARSIDWE
jgi:hypothetical protein